MGQQTQQHTPRQHLTRHDTHIGLEGSMANGAGLNLPDDVASIRGDFGLNIGL
jgi:hypothetical protein